MQAGVGQILVGVLFEDGKETRQEAKQKENEIGSSKKVNNS